MLFPLTLCSLSVPPLPRFKVASQPSSSPMSTFLFKKHVESRVNNRKSKKKKRHLSERPVMMTSPKVHIERDSNPKGIYIPTWVDGFWTMSWKGCGNHMGRGGISVSQVSYIRDWKTATKIYFRRDLITIVPMVTYIHTYSYSLL